MYSWVLCRGKWMEVEIFVVGAVGFAFIGEPPSGERQGSAKRDDRLANWRTHNLLGGEGQLIGNVRLPLSLSG